MKQIPDLETRSPYLRLRGFPAHPPQCPARRDNELYVAFRNLEAGESPVSIWTYESDHPVKIRICLDNLARPSSLQIMELAPMTDLTPSSVKEVKEPTKLKESEKPKELEELNKALTPSSKDEQSRADSITAVAQSIRAMVWEVALLGPNDTFRAYSRTRFTEAIRRKLADLHL